MQGEQPLPSCDFDPASVSVAEAAAYVSDNVSPVSETEQVAVYDARGRVTAVDVKSAAPVPNHTNSAMDGYALAGDELPAAGEARFEVIGTAMAGAPFHGEVRAGQCVRIMTGAVMPEGTDSVVMQERTGGGDGFITVGAGEKKGANVRYAGEDIRQGETVVPAGVRLGASQLGVLASLGEESVSVFRKPRVAFFSNGDELRPVGAPLALGEVYDSNRYTLHAMLGELGVEQVDLGVVRDDREAIADTLREAAARADVVITSAGASVGDADYIRDILAEQGQAHFWKVAIKPGRPLSFGRLSGGALFFGLPGNPVSVMVTFQVFLEPAIRRLAGERTAAPMVLKMRTVSDLRKRAGRVEYQRGVMYADENGETVVRSTGDQGSGILSSMCRANCYVVLPDESEGARAGDWVEVRPFGRQA